MKSSKIKIAIAGLGNVGSGVVEIIKKDCEKIKRATSLLIEVVAVSARSSKPFIENQNIQFFSDPLEMVEKSGADIIVELIGGVDIAKTIVELAIKKNIPVVTANKALLAVYGIEIAKLAEKNNVLIGYEASVGGSIPVIGAIKNGLVANQINSCYAIINGTCNFILSKMQNENIDFSNALKQAQELGYAESDPTFDIKGIDSAHKIAVLAIIAFGIKQNFENINIEGIDKITIDDIKIAQEFGFRIKLIAHALCESNILWQSVHPALISDQEKIANIDGSLNSILISTNNAKWQMMIGAGAGSLPTASAVIADIIEIAKLINYGVSGDISTFGYKVDDLQDIVSSDINQKPYQFLVRINFNKEKLSQFLKNNDVVNEVFGSELKITQSYFLDKENEIVVGIITEKYLKSDLETIISKLNNNLVKNCSLIRIEEINAI